MFRTDERLTIGEDTHHDGLYGKRNGLGRVGKRQRAWGLQKLHKHCVLGDGDQWVRHREGHREELRLRGEGAVDERGGHLGRGDGRSGRVVCDEVRGLERRLEVGVGCAVEGGRNVTASKTGFVVGVNDD